MMKVVVLSVLSVLTVMVFVPQYWVSIQKVKLNVPFVVEAIVVMVSCVPKSMRTVVLAS